MLEILPENIIIENFYWGKFTFFKVCKVFFLTKENFNLKFIYKFDRIFKYSYNFGLANSPRQKGNSNDETKYPSKLPTSSLHGHYNWFQIFDWFN